ncbi:MAG: hypothetical protein WAU13_06110, partial [Albidovulum sp.]
MEGAGDADALVARAEALSDRLTAAGAHLNLPKGSVRQAVETGLATLVGRGVVRRDGNDVSCEPEQTAMLTFYAASVGQLLDAPAASPGERVITKSPDRRVKRHKVSKQ